MPIRLSKDRTLLCSFSFADGRRCRSPRHSAHQPLCTFHARQEAETLAAQQVGRQIASTLSHRYLSACDLASALSHLFSAVAQGQVNTKAASALGYLSQSLVQTIPLAQDEYINAFGTDAWRDVIRNAFPPSEQKPAPTSRQRPPVQPSRSDPSQPGRNPVVDPTGEASQSFQQSQ